MTDIALEREHDLDEDEPKLPKPTGVRMARKALTVDKTVSGAQLAAQHGMSDRWWRMRLSEAREEIERAAARPPASNLADPARPRSATTDSRHAVPTAARNAVPTGTESASTTMPTEQPGTASPLPARPSVPTTVPTGSHGVDQMPELADDRHQVDPAGMAPASARQTARPSLTAENRPQATPETIGASAIAPISPAAAPDALPEGPAGPATHLGNPPASERATEPADAIGQVGAPTLPTARPARADVLLSVPTGTAAPNEASTPVPPTPTNSQIGTPLSTSASTLVPTGTPLTELASTTVPTGTVPSTVAPAPVHPGVPTGTPLAGTTEVLHAAPDAARDAVPTASTSGTTAVADRPAPKPVEPLVDLVDQAEVAVAAKLQYAFYGVAVVFALVGQVWAGVTIIPFPDSLPLWARILIVAPALAVIELAGVATSHQADLRRRLGEQAYGYRTLSLLAAGVAAGFNLAGHWGDWFPAIGFTGLSVFAYCSWLMQSNARRRDALRAAGKLAATAPVYGVAQWACGPRLTRRARTLAVEHGYGVHESLRVAREEACTEQRRTALAAAIKRRIIELHPNDEIGATIAATTYDLDRLAAGVEGRLDYASAEEFIAADLVLTRDRTGEQA
jgi:hypothetical protein